MTGTVKSFDAIANIAQLQEEEAAAILADSLTRKQQAERQLKQLESYLNDYKKAQNDDSANSAKNVYKIRNEKLFFQRLQFLIDRQTQEIHDIQQTIDAAINDWKSNKIYNKVLNRLIHKYADERTNLLAQYEQKAHDDYAAHHNHKKLLQ